MSRAVQERLSVAEFERRYLGKRAELWRGEVRECMPTGARHGQTTARITVRLGAYLTGADEGELLAAERDTLHGAPALPNLQIPVRELFG